MPTLPQQFLAAMRRFASAVTVVTTHDGTRDYGLTVTSFCSVSLEPTLILICVDRDATGHNALIESTGFAVNLLSADQSELSEKFGDVELNNKERFDGVSITRAKDEIPILAGTSCALVCAPWRIYDGGDHSIIVGEVSEIALDEAKLPLLYHDRHYGRFSQGDQE